MAYFGHDSERTYKEEYEVHEYEDRHGNPWIEIFPFVFAEIGEDAQPMWDNMRILNPNLEGMTLFASGSNSAYRATPQQFSNALWLFSDEVPWLKGVECYESDEWNVAKLLAHLTLGFSHDEFGMRWIDRLTWIDSIATYITEENRDAFRRVDFHRNVALFRELNWLSVVVTSSDGLLYRELTQQDFDNWELNTVALDMARSCEVSDGYFEEFIVEECENSMVRDLVVAHLLFENSVDLNPDLVPERYVGTETQISRGKLRGMRYDVLKGARRPDFWTIRANLGLPALVDEHRETLDVPHDIPIDRAEISVGRVVKVLTGEMSADKLLDFELVFYDVIRAHIAQNPSLYPNLSVNLVDMSVHRFDLATRRSKWVFDELAFFSFAPRLDLTRFLPTNHTERYIRIMQTGSPRAAALFLAVSGFTMAPGIEANAHGSHDGVNPVKLSFQSPDFYTLVKSYYGLYQDSVSDSENDW